MANALDLVIAEINKKYKKEIIKQGTDLIYVEKIPFSSPRANYMTYGGIPIGKSTEFFGPEGGGKTTSALDVTAQAQKRAQRRFKEELSTIQTKIDELESKDLTKTSEKQLDKLNKELEELEARGPRRCIYIDLENTLDEEWAEKIGVNLEELYLMRPDDETAEEVLQMVLDLIKSGMIELLVIDSVPMLVGQNVHEEDMSKKSYGGIAGVLTDFSKRVSPLLTQHKTALLSINQIREDLQNPHNQYHTPGGRAWKHFHSLRLYFRKGSFIDEDYKEVPQRTENPAGNMVDIHIVKTKVCKPDRRIGQYTLRYDTSIDSIRDTVFMATKYNMVVKNSSWYSIIDPETAEIIEVDGKELKFQGEAALLEYLHEDEEIYGEIYEAVTAKLAEVN